MNQQLRKTRWLAVAALIAVAACDDGESEPDRPTMQEEGLPCFDPEECREELTCVQTEYALNDQPLGVCARGCTTDSDCDGERCERPSGERGYCANVVEQEYELCGVFETAVCAEDLVCLLSPDQPVGVCVRLCPLDAAAPAGDAGAAMDEDAGVEGPAGICSAEQSCVDDVLANPDGNGVCGTIVQRGEDCTDLGAFCEAEDVCVPEELANPESALRCFERCGPGAGTCEESTCTVVGNRYAYCP